MGPANPSGLADPARGDLFYEDPRRPQANWRTGECDGGNPALPPGYRMEPEIPAENFCMDEECALESAPTGRRRPAA